MQAAECIGDDDASIVREQLGAAMRNATNGPLITSLPEEMRLLLETLEAEQGLPEKAVLTRGAVIRTP